MWTKQQAEAEAKTLRSSLPRGWKIRVWENFGWHVSARRGAVTMHVEERYPVEKYRVLIGSTDGAVGGFAPWTPANTGGFSTPREALSDAASHARRVLNQLTKIVISVEEELDQMS